MTTTSPDHHRQSDAWLAHPEVLYRLDWREVYRAFRAQPVGFKLACLYLFIEYVRPQSVWPVLDFLPWAQLTILIGLLAISSEIGRRGMVRAPTNAQVLLFLVVVLLSVVTAYLPARSIDRWDVFLPWVVVYFFISNAVAGRVQLLLFVVVFLLCSFKMSQHGFRSWAASGFGFRSWGVTGAPGFFHNSGEVGIQMCIFLPMSLMFLRGLWHHLSPARRALIALLPITAAGTIIATNSRGAVLGGVAAMIWLTLIGRSKIKAAAALIMAFGLAWLVLPSEFVARFEQMGSDETSQARLVYWRDGIEMFLQHPLLGVGFENWLPYYAAHYSGLEGYYHSVQVSHNIFIQAASELGVLGLGTFLVMIATTFAMNARSRRLARQAGDDFLVRLAHGFDAAMIGFLISAQFVTVLYYPYFWIALPMTVMLYTAAREAAGVPFSSRSSGVQRRTVVEQMRKVGATHTASVRRFQ